MAYFTGTANNPADLLLKLKSHAESIGWITDWSNADTWCCHNNDGYWSIKAFDNRLELCGNSGFQSGLAWDNQPGNSKNHTTNNNSAYRYNPYAQTGAGPFVVYHLFAASDYLHLTVEIASGQFRPLFIGTLDKRGAVYNGGQYVCGSYESPSDKGINRGYSLYPFDGFNGYYPAQASRIRLDAQDGAPSPDWLFFSSGGSYPRYAAGLGRGYCSNNHPSSLLVETSANALTGGTLLIPCTIYTVGAENRTRMIGEVKDFAVCRMDYLSPGDTITVGQEQWRVFPPIERTALDAQGSGMVGYAYKVIA